MKNKKSKKVNEVVKEAVKPNKPVESDHSELVFTANQIKTLFDAAVVNRSTETFVYQASGPNMIAVCAVIDDLDFDDSLPPVGEETEEDMEQEGFMEARLESHGVLPFYDHNLLHKVNPVELDLEDGTRGKRLMIEILLTTETLPCFLHALADIEDMWDYLLDDTEETAKASETSFEIEGNGTVN
jgi:hypothetical protein